MKGIQIGEQVPKVLNLKLMNDLATACVVFGVAKNNTNMRLATLS